MSDYNTNIRQIIDENLNKDELDYNNMFLLPSSEIIDNLSIEQFIKICDIDEKDIYEIKCELFNKYLKNKIIDNI